MRPTTMASTTRATEALSVASSTISRRSSAPSSDNSATNGTSAYIPEAAAAASPAWRSISALSAIYSTRAGFFSGSFGYRDQASQQRFVYRDFDLEYLFNQCEGNIGRLSLQSLLVTTRTTYLKSVYHTGRGAGWIVQPLDVR